MNLFDKLHTDFISIISMVGMAWLAIMLIGYTFDWQAISPGGAAKPRSLPIVPRLRFAP
jgi:hypothetical protein